MKRRPLRRLCAAGILLLAARAGLGAQELSLIVNADDVGAHPGFTDASLQALLAGKLSSCSVLVTGKDAERALRILKDHPELDVGVHLTLNGDQPPLTPPAEAPSLYSEQGTLWETPGQAAGVAPPEAQREWEAQVRKALEAGVRVTHLDSHMGCYFHSRELYRAALAVAQKYRVPLVSPCIPAWASPQEPYLLQVASYTGVYALEGATESLENRAEAYRRLLGGLHPGLHYLYTHHARPPQGPPPAAPAEVIGDLDIRVDEFDFWTGPLAEHLLRELRERGCRLVGIPPG